MAAVRLVLGQLLALGALASASWGLGRRLVSALPLRPGAEHFAFATAAGMGTLSTALFGLGLLGWLTKWGVFLLAALAIVAGAAPLGRRGLPAAASPPGRCESRRWPLALLGGALLLPAFVLSLYPPTGFDATTYHLPSAAAFARSHRLVVLPDLLFPVFPQLLEVLFSAMLLVAGDVAAHAVQYLCMVAIAAAVYAAGERFADRRAGLLAAALWIANPLVHYQAASAYIDLGYALFAVLAVLAWEGWRAEDRRGWLLTSGAFAGLAAGTKYLGLLWVGLLGVATGVAGPRGRRWFSAGLFVLAAGVALAPWYLRIFAETGNPVFPFFSDRLGGDAGSRLAGAVSAPGAAWGGSSRWFTETTLGTLRNPWPLLSLPWRVAFDRRSFNLQAPLSPYYLLVLPLAAWQARRDRRLRRWLVMVVAYAALWTWSDLRFQLPSAALLAAAGGICLSRLLDHRWFRPLGGAAWVAIGALLLATLGPAYAAFKVGKHGAVPTTSAARQAFLARALPGYSTISYLNAQCGGAYTVYGLGAENLTYFAQGRFRGQRGGPFAQSRVEPLLGDPEKLHALLRSWGVDYLLINLPSLATGRALGESPGSQSYFRPLLSTQQSQLFELLARRRDQDAAGQLPPPSPALLHCSPHTPGG